MLTKLAIWYLRKRKRSVMIGFTVQRNLIQSTNRNAYLYDNILVNIKYCDFDGGEVVLPKGKFHIQTGGKQ